MMNKNRPLSFVNIKHEPNIRETKTNFPHLLKLLQFFHPTQAQSRYKFLN